MRFQVRVAAAAKLSGGKIGVGRAEVDVREIAAADAPVCVRQHGVTAVYGTTPHYGEVVFRNFEDRFWRPHPAETLTNTADAWSEVVMRSQGSLKPLVSSREEVKSLYDRSDAAIIPNDEDMENSAALEAIRAKAAESVVIDGIFHEASPGPVYAAPYTGFAEHAELRWETASVPFRKMYRERLLAFGHGDVDMANELVRKLWDGKAPAPDSRTNAPVIVEDLPGRGLDFASAAVECLAWIKAWTYAHNRLGEISRETAPIQSRLVEALSRRSPLRSWNRGRMYDMAWPHELSALDIRPADDLVPIIEDMVGLGEGPIWDRMASDVVERWRFEKSWKSAPTSDDDLDAIADAAPQLGS